MIKGLAMREIILYYPGGLGIVTWVLKSRASFQVVVREEDEIIKIVSGRCHVSGLKMYEKTTRQEMRMTSRNSKNRDTDFPSVSLKSIIALLTLVQPNEIHVRFWTYRKIR